MPILHLDLKLGLSTDKTRTLLGEYSRGCVSNEVTYTPKIEFDPYEERYFSVNNSNTFIFLSDFFGSDPSFDVTLIKSDNTITNLSNCNVLIIDCSDIATVKIQNKSHEVRRAHVVR